jgi:hypothetical protein
LRAGNNIDCFIPSASEHDNFSMRHKLRRRFKKQHRKQSTSNNQLATINATAIDWHQTPEPADDTGVIYYHIDRTTDILTENFTYHLPNGSTQSDDPTTYRCTVGGARPTILRFRR